MTHPYRGLPANQYWRSAMAHQAPGLMNPCQPHARKILPSDKIATMGSCFAQHVSHALDQHGFQRFITESGPDWMAPEFAQAQQFGLYSARYGNVYTPRQAYQLLLRALGEFAPEEPPWLLANHATHLADPFRPSVQPNGFKSPDELLADRALHLAAVREMFLKADWLVLTLGLTEAWCSLVDGAVFPVAPGVMAGSADTARHAFVNFSVSDCITDLAGLCRRARAINPRIEIILTVSPVALAATYEPRHVWTSTVYSKSVLRVAAEHCAQQLDYVSYFPAYEIITSPLNASRYLADDMREVNATGVAHVMRCFFETYTDAATPLPAASTLGQDMTVVCEERQLDTTTAATVATTAVTLPVPADFDEAAYLQANPDVAEGVATGIIDSGRTHYMTYGRFENRRLQPDS